MKLKLLLCCVFSLFFSKTMVYSQEAKSFKPDLWLQNPQRIKDTVKEFDKLNFQSRLSLSKKNIWTSTKKINNSNHLFVVYKSNRDENLISLIGSGKSLFLDGKKLKLNDSIDLNGYNEAYGELLDVQFSGIEDGKFWLNPNFKESNIFEIILIEKSGQTAAVNDVRTYLSIKYGIDLIDYKQYGYSGKKWWDGAGKSFNHNIFGLAKMDYFNLNNYKSTHSKDQDLIVFNSGSVETMFQEGDYLLFGNNKKSLTFDRKTKLSNKQWLGQTNKEKAVVDLAFPVNKLNQDPDSFTEYELIVGNKGLKTVYTGEVKDSLLIFQKVVFTNAENQIVKLKEYKADLKFETVTLCDQFQLKVEAPSNIANYSVKIYDDKNVAVLSSVNLREVYTIKNTSSAYFDVMLTYNNKKSTKRVDTGMAVLNPKGLNKHYTMYDGAITIKLPEIENVKYQWFKNDQEIGQGSHVTLDTEGNYSLKVSNGEDCWQTKPFTVGNDFNDGGWRVYPNPALASEEVSIMFQLAEASDVQLSIYTNEGRLVKSVAIGTVENETYNLGALQLSSGVYILVAYINKVPQIKKIIIK
ncbi:T9SS type A sorting domain-containing protein [Paenimyroides baculatum]|uniref:T9SS type A sorting domain-containing protein n=1 Tax=Paenimyroides baculatum TaxID=2608000 RepID=A0A5M6CKM1_9FLAO|nr:T9SS type A sorting domain-containing protein [Paenimyroides baculatum]KAA5535583.1 T9SS type A sorting domain-containing protein [Paenimyroides baculatum]